MKDKFKLKYVEFIMSHIADPFTKYKGLSIEMGDTGTLLSIEEIQQLRDYLNEFLGEVDEYKKIVEDAYKDHTNPY